ncbi:FIST signal transduction protein [Clostridium thailandense]|uniref:FIST signal transduction protein n=1 Tax=Clostridium thailandense TaxID=2794346 RepID=UPI0039892A11
MKIEQVIWKKANNNQIIARSEDFNLAQLVLVFGARDLISRNDYMDSIQKKYPNAYIIGCSTAGEIIGNQVLDGTLTTTAINFEHTTVENFSVKVKNFEDSYEVGATLAEKLNKEHLAHVFVLSEGLNIHGSELVRGIKEHLPAHISITGGMAGDDVLFGKTYVIANGCVDENIVSTLGFYGDRIKIGYGSMGGWDSFGPERLITKSQNNILYEIDGKSALDLYKLYLGDYAQGLPSTGLRFPLSIRLSSSEDGVVRTLLKINEEDQGMIFAGDVPEGHYAKFMKANFERLINGALEAAELSLQGIGSTPTLAILISCIGRKMMLKQRIEEEVEAVRDILGDDCIFTGFYSYGEISPNIRNINSKEVECKFHNQTMTITTIKEI